MSPRWGDSLVRLLGEALVMVPISVRSLSKSFGAVQAVRSLSFDVTPGRITAFLGPNGAGKTTTLRMILGLVRPSAGSALIGGSPYASLRTPRRTVGAVLEHTGFHPDRRARDHLRVSLPGVSSSRIDSVLSLVDLGSAGDRRVGGFSLGMRQRLGLASALLGDPSVLLLDEPANGLDPSGIAWLRSLLRSLASEGRTVLVSSHVLSEVSQLADDAVIVHEGQLRYSGPVASLGDSLESAFLSLTTSGGAR
jgi:ABC-2 type transport system ATP-binding protein